VADKPWSGVFDEATDHRVERFTQSVSFDRRLFAQDIRGSIAHARMLASVGLISLRERDQLVSGLEAICEEIRAGTFEFRECLEDVHMNIEAALVDRLGDVGRKLHTARSRNDQVSTDFRLWIRERIDALCGLLEGVQRAFVGRCERDADVVLPGYTHLQRAQPVLATHYWLAWCEKLERDRERLADCRRRVNLLPLGTAALAGTSLPIDRDMVAQELGFDGLVQNSLESSSDRDFAIEFAFCLAMIAEHLSSWAEEWILWSTVEFGLIKLPQAYCTGSSIMPQKINPDVLELIRGKAARVIGNLTSLLVLVKGLPLAYNRDLQEDKERVFDSADTVEACLALAALLIAGTELRREQIAAGLEQGFLDATALMEHLISRGVPQRAAHHAIGQLVAAAMKQDKSLAELPLEELRRAHGELDQTVYQVLGARNAVAAMSSEGSTGPEQVARQLRKWREKLGM
jgi:argininosuccinate lyase